MSLIYKQVVTNVGRLVPRKLQPFWNHPAGPQTIFFWAPTFKWGLVVAGLADYSRPAEQLSITQSTALAATGSIWARYSLVIIPKNWNLFAVNIFLGLTGFWQLTRIYLHHKSLEESTD
ncbi:Mitochondrial pyruvate carrier 2 [Lamellibrachia satsuma]|nr:Mitochondrial pyruvate carrier 2 [Lamellibrachia satsuma]KAI0241522.1 Mitochondrial pyruvate carrier 2 [Lamellibrachia satsuma]